MARYRAGNQCAPDFLKILLSKKSMCCVCVCCVCCVCVVCVCVVYVYFVCCVCMCACACTCVHTLYMHIMCAMCVSVSLCVLTAKAVYNYYSHALNQLSELYSFPVFMTLVINIMERRKLSNKVCCEYLPKELKGTLF